MGTLLFTFFLLSIVGMIITFAVTASIRPTTIHVSAVDVRGIYIGNRRDGEYGRRHRSGRSEFTCHPATSRRAGHVGVALGDRTAMKSSMEIELADAVAVVRDELIEAAARGVGSGMEFVVGPIELEFIVELKVDAKAKLGFKAWVLSSDVELGVARGRTHKVKFTVTPRKAGGGDLLVAGDATRVDGVGGLSGHIGR